MSRSALGILLLSVIAGYFGLGAIAGNPAMAAVALIGVFVAVLLITLIYESTSRRRWMV